MKLKTETFTRQQVHVLFKTNDAFKSKPFRKLFSWRIGGRQDSNKNQLAWFQYLQQNFNYKKDYSSAIEFLTSYNKSIEEGTMEIKPYSKDRGLARELSPLSGDIITKYIPTIELSEDELFFTADGKRVTDKWLRSFRIALEEEVFSDSPIAQYFVKADVKRFSREINKNKNNAISLIKSTSDPEKRERLAAQYASIVNTPKMIVDVTSEYSPRLFATGQQYTLGSCDKALREALLDGLYYFDIANAYLTFIASVWGSEVIEGFLSSGRSLWVELGLDNKMLFKKWFYSLCFCKPKKKIEKEITEILGAEAAKTFFNHDIIKEIAKKSKERMKYAEDNVIYCPVKGTPLIGKSSNPFASIVSQELQGFETLIMESVFRLAAQRSDLFAIISYEFDGASFSVVDQRQLQQVQTLIEQTMIDCAKNLGIDNLKVKFGQHKFTKPVDTVEVVPTFNPVCYKTVIRETVEKGKNNGKETKESKTTTERSDLPIQHIHSRTAPEGRGEGQGIGNGREGRKVQTSVERRNEANGQSISRDMGRKVCSSRTGSNSNTRQLNEILSTANKNIIPNELIEFIETIEENQEIFTESELKMLSQKLELIVLKFRQGLEQDLSGFYNWICFKFERSLAS